MLNGVFNLTSGINLDEFGAAFQTLNGDDRSDNKMISVNSSLLETYCKINRITYTRPRGVRWLYFSTCKLLRFSLGVLLYAPSLFLFPCSQRKMEDIGYGLREIKRLDDHVEENPVVRKVVDELREKRSRIKIVKAPTNDLNAVKVHLFSGVVELPKCVLKSSDASAVAVSGHAMCYAASRWLIISTKILQYISFGAICVVGTILAAMALFPANPLAPYYVFVLVGLAVSIGMFIGGFIADMYLYRRAAQNVLLHVLHHKEWVVEIKGNDKKEKLTEIARTLQWMINVNEAQKFWNLLAIGFSVASTIYGIGKFLVYLIRLPIFSVKLPAIFALQEQAAQHYA
jgi:hypothetical protein